jgi:TrmH family RNA methyltransferase
VQRITSRQNPIVAEYRDAARGALHDTLLLDGVHLIGEAIAAGLALRHVIIAADALERSDIAAIVERMNPATVEVATASGPVMEVVSPVRSSSAIVALAARPRADLVPFRGHAPVVIACDVQDPGNIGAIVRVVEAAGGSGVIVAGQSADPFGWKALRGSMGSALRLPLTSAATIEGAVAEARSHGRRVVATVPRGGVPLFSADLSGAIALLIGGEGQGLSRHVADAADLRVTIPMQPPVESLNASVAAAILLYEARRQREHMDASHRNAARIRTAGRH